MTSDELRARSRQFAIAIVRLCRSLPADWIVRTVGGQLLRSGTSVAANYRACGRARSDREFCSKIGLVAEESDESLLWLELLPHAAPSTQSNELEQLTNEANELTAIFTASHATAKRNLRKKKEQRRLERQQRT